MLFKMAIHRWKTTNKDLKLMVSHFQRFQWSVWLAFIFGLIPALGWAWFRSGGFVWEKGQSALGLQTESSEQPTWYQVSGPSMAPTLFGDAMQQVCSYCEQRNLFFLYQNGSGAEHQLRCSECKQLCSRVEGLAKFSGDQVRVSTLLEDADELSDTLQRGDLVALKQDGAVHVKRLVALPGEVVGLSGRHLTVDSIRIEDLLYRDGCQFPAPWLTVHRDEFSERIPWVTHNSVTNSQTGWKRTTDGVWFTSENQPSWLIYSPGIIGDKQIKSPVWDDFPFNVGLRRKLFSVDRLRVSGVSLKSQQITIHFWTEEGIRHVERILNQGESFSIDTLEATEFIGPDAVLAPIQSVRPIAIGCAQAGAELDKLKVERMVEYRLRPHDDSGYPLRWSSDEYFFLGDNVPVSVDSRDWGPVTATSLIGIVEEVTRPLP